MLKNIVKLLIALLLLPAIASAYTGTVQLTNTGIGYIQINPTNEIIGSGESLDYTYDTEVETYFTVSNGFVKACFSMDCTAQDENEYTELDINDPYYYDSYPTEIIFFFNVPYSASYTDLELSENVLLSLDPAIKNYVNSITIVESNFSCNGVNAFGCYNAGNITLTKSSIVNAWNPEYPFIYFMLHEFGHANNFVIGYDPLTSEQDATDFAYSYSWMWL